MYRFLFNILLKYFLLDFWEWDAGFKSMLSKDKEHWFVIVQHGCAEGCSLAQSEH